MFAITIKRIYNRDTSFEGGNDEKVTIIDGRHSLMWFVFYGGQAGVGCRSTGG